MKALVPLCLVSLLGTACTTDALLSEASVEIRKHAPLLIQPGEDQLLLAVTDDNYAVYQEGQTLYATKLAPGSPRLFVGDVPGTNIPQVLQVGEVVFVWTDPQRNLPGFGVSPLVMFTGNGGAQLISAQSSVALVATAASSDSRQIVFTTNATDDGARGDLVHAFTKDPLHPTTLLANTTLAFPNGRCRPLANFGRDGHGREVPVATYCAGEDVTATLSKWVRGVKTDLVSNIATPLQFILDSDADARTFLVGLANDSVATVTMAGEITVVDPTTRVRSGFIGAGGAVGYTVPGAPVLRLAPDGQTPQTLTPVTAVYRGLHDRAAYSKPRTLSPDGTLALIGTTYDPATGLTDMNLLDVTTGETIPLETETNSTVFNELFTSDGDHALFFKAVDLANGTGTLVAGDRDGTTRELGEGVWDALAGFGDDVTFNTNPVIDGSSLRSFLLSTGDLFVVDVDHPHASPRAISTRANLFYLPSHDRKKVVFSSAVERCGPGLYLARARD